MQEGRESGQKEFPSLSGPPTVQKTVIDGFFPITIGRSVGSNVPPRAERVANLNPLQGDEPS